MGDDDDTGAFYSFKQRVVYSLFRGAARVGLRLSMPLGQMEDLLRLAYFREARVERGMLLPDVARVFGKSLRTVASVSKTFQSDFFAPEDQLAFRRAIVRHLDDQPMSRDALVALWPERADVGVAIDDLMREGKVAEVDGLLIREPSQVEFFDDGSSDRQIDGLNRQMDILASAVWQRVVERRTDGSAAARSYVFDASEQDFDALVAELQQTLRDRAIEADSAANKRGISVRRAVTFSATTLDEDVP